MSASPLRHIPSLSEILENPKLKTLAARLRPGEVVATVRVVLDELTTEFHAAATEKTLPSVSELAERISRRVLEQRPPRPTRAINATGVLLHSELGTPPWPEEAIRSLEEFISGYSSRGSEPSVTDEDEAWSRGRHQLRDLTRAEDVLVFHNAAAATVAAMAALGAGREMIVSRGQVIQRGRRYCLPELIKDASVALREIGAANHAGLDDYCNAIGEQTAAILVVHRHDMNSLDGEQQISIEALARLAREHQLPLIHDLGPASLVDLATFGVKFAPRVSDSMASGADLVLFGSELLGGPPCGIVVGRTAWVKMTESRAASHAAFLGQPLLGSLAATFDQMNSHDQARASIPLVQLLAASSDNLKNRAERLAAQMTAADAIERAEVIEATGHLVGPQHPLGVMNGWGIALQPSRLTAGQLAKCLRAGSPAVIGQQVADRLVLNLRAVSPQSDLELVERILQVGK